jgi:hypothetical protein
MLLGKPEGKGPMGSSRRKWEMDLKEIVWNGVDWIRLAQVKNKWQYLVHTVMNRQVP